MKTKLIFMTLSVMATLMLGNGATAGATSNQKDVKPATAKEVTVTVKSGDTLETIATEHKTTYVRLFNANPSIVNPDVIDVGDKITIPTKDKNLEDRFSKVAPVVTAAPVTYTTQQ